MSKSKKVDVSKSTMTSESAATPVAKAQEPAAAMTPATPETPNVTEKADQSAELAILVSRINDGHSRLGGVLKTTAEIARSLGQDLIAARTIVKARKDCWTQWLKENTKVSPRQSAKYIRLAQRWEELTKTHDPANFSIEQNLALLNSPSGSIADIAQAASGTQPEPLPRNVFEVPEKTLNEKRLQAHELEESSNLDFSEDTPEAKFVKSVLDYVGRQVRKQVSAMKHRGAVEGLDLAIVAIAVGNKIKADLNAKAVLFVTEPEATSEPAAAPAQHPHNGVNGKASLAKAA